MAKAKKQEIQHDEVVARFAARLRQKRLDRGFTQAELAEAAQTSPAYLGRLERGGAAPGVDLVAKLASALGCKIAELLPDEDEPDAAAVLRDRARTLFDELVETDDQAALSLLVQFMSRLSQTASSDD